MSLKLTVKPLNERFGFQYLLLSMYAVPDCYTVLFICALCYLHAVFSF